VTRLFSDDGTQFIVAADNLIHTFDAATGRPVHTLRGNVNQIADMVALPGGKLRTIEPDCTIRDWDLARVEPVRTAIVELAGRPAAQGPIAQSVVSADGAWWQRSTEKRPTTARCRPCPCGTPPGKAPLN
jgi:WD40 repeat protein